MGFISRSCFESDGLKLIRTNEIEEQKNDFFHTNQLLITSFYIKKQPIFCRISDESALIRNSLRNGRVRGLTVFVTYKIYLIKKLINCETH